MSPASNKIALFIDGANLYATYSVYQGNLKGLAFGGGTTELGPVSVRESIVGAENIQFNLPKEVS